MTKSIIFDLGAVMVDWNPQAIAQNFTTDKALQNNIIQQLFQHKNWLDFDQGLITENKLIERSSKIINLSMIQLNRLMQQAKESLSAKQDMVKLLQLAHDTGLKTYCLSNLSHEWFDYLRNRHAFFELFDGQVISAQEKVSKPNPQIYLRLIERYSLEKSHCLFIDDREENIQAAKNLGIKGIIFQHSSDNLRAIKDFILS